MWRLAGPDRCARTRIQGCSWRRRRCLSCHTMLLEGPGLAPGTEPARQLRDGRAPPRQPSHACTHARAHAPRSQRTSTQEPDAKPDDRPSPTPRTPRRGPRRAAVDARGEALDVAFDAWVMVDRRALRLALASMSSASAGHARVREYRRATAAWEGRGRPGAVLPAQYRALDLALPRASYDKINIVAFANYILGFGYVRSDLDLQGATSLATALKALVPAQVQVRAAAAIVETCRGADAWRVERVALGRLRRALVTGETP